MMIMSAGHWNEAPRRLAPEIKSRVKEKIGMVGGARAGVDLRRFCYFHKRKIDTH